MGVASLILGILGYCICWIPGVGWLGVAMGAAACGLGVPSVALWFSRSGYTAWGISGTMLGTGAVSLGLAYQVKHAGGVLDFLIRPLPCPLAYYIIAALTGLLVLGVVLARLWKQRALGLALAFLAVAGLAASGGSALLTADRSAQRSPSDGGPGAP